MAITTKAALAAELRISKARVSQYVKAGMPVRSDGKLNREEALRWVSTNQLSQTYEDKGANRARKLEKPSKLKASPGPMVGNYEPEVAVARAILGPAYRLIAERAVEAGVSIEMAYALALRVASELDDLGSKTLVRCGFPGFAKTLTIGDLCDVREFPDPDWPALAKKTGTTFDELACERFVGQFEDTAAA
ncbi:hypothetical protein LOK46_25605 [Methylobacterium sp. NMS14P]|uniref:hypothetical protein n=1 Tax=Methylobacterium sp. NMS14P TaxID=2894310 RepID=UPI002358DB09|nr:hypothetical protein [Methylobacterium sp. NMS14P]WCS24471.1 hypothetical protein LOK46_25605 [Methylobacterium sp. NMS14P]